VSAYTVTSLAELAKLIERHGRQRTQRVLAATKRAARRAAEASGSALKRQIPVAHGELRESVRIEGDIIIVDAPHAAAVNFGSRPHTPPLEPLVAWVKLRGMQGLLTERQMNRLPGTTTKDAATGVAEMLRAHEMRGPFGYSPTDAAVQVARMIQRAIAKKGTKAHHFIEKAMPDLRRILLEELQRAIGQSPGGGGPAGGAAAPAPTRP
jgi:hypothetical protein